MLKRVVSLMFAVLLAVSMFAGCGSSSSGNGETNTTSSTTSKGEAATAKDPENISLMTPWAFPQEILDQFKAKTGIEVKQDVVPNSTTDYLQARNARMASGAELDIIGADGSDPADFAKKGTIIELTNEAWMKNFTDDSLKLMSQFTATPDKQFSAVFEALTFGVWYNKDIFKQYNIEVPTNYEDFTAICETLKKNGVTPMVQGGKDVWPLDQELNMFLEAIYTKYPNTWIDLYTGKVKFTDPDIVKEAKKLEVFYPDRNYYAKGTLSTTYDQAWQLMLQKKAAMWFMGSWASEVMTKSNVQPEFEVGVFCPPMNYKGEAQYDAKILSRNFCILSNSKKTDAAKKYLEFLTQPDIAQLFVDKGMTISTVKNVSSSTMVAGEDWAKLFALPMGGQNMLNKIAPDGKLYIPGAEFLKVKNMLEANIVDGKMTVEQYLAELQKAQDIDIKNYK